MATAPIILPLLGGVPDVTNPPQVLWTTAGRPHLAFDETTDELITWGGIRLPDHYSSTPVVILQWSSSAASAPATSETVRWAVEVMKETPETGTAAMDTDSFDSPNEDDDDALGTNAKRLQEISITLTNFDGADAGDNISIRISRNADHANDDLTEDAWLWAVEFNYTTT